jgi:hypothetical protein
MPSSSTNTRLPSRRLLAALLLVAATAMTLLVSSASAGSTASIEGIWSFEHGQIGIKALSNGTFEGTVVEETTFGECPHPVGQPIWTDITAQADGSYWGLHQWYFEHESCKANPELGRTAWRVMEEPNGSKYLLVCLSNPGPTEPQPTIAANGTHANASYGCFRSDLTAALPTTGSPPGSNSAGSNSGSTPKSGVLAEVERLSLPSAKKCLSVRLFQIHLAEPKYDPFKTVLVTIKGHKIATSRHGNYVVATISLKGLKKGTFTVKIAATTVLGHHLSGSRTYHTCAKKAKSSKPGKLH